MSLVLLGVLIALGLIILGKNVPQFQKFPQIRFVLAVLVLAVTVAVSTAKIVPPGNVGVLILFGKVYGTISEGVHLVNPLATMELMSVRTKEVFEHAEAPSKEGLNVALEVSCLYHLKASEAANVYRQVGPNYEAVVVNPQFRAAIRGITVNHEAKDLYTSSRELISTEIFKDLEGNLGKRGIVVETILLRKVDLPKLVVEAINAKLAADQQAQQMRFVLDKERQEAERKRIEAQGIQDFQRIISQGLTEQLLRWKGIETTRALAESPNSKTVIIGGRDGMPLIFNTATGRRFHGKMIDNHQVRHYVKAMIGRRKSLIGSLVLAALLSLAVVSSGAGAGAVADANRGNPGQPLDVKRLLVKGKTTLIDFHSPFCPPCVQLAPIMAKLAAKRPDLAIKKVNINRPDSPGD